jgi:peptidoglycan-N-acetylglucosamine deacetylase
MMLPPVVMPANINVQALGARWIEDLDYMVKDIPEGVFAPVFHPQSIGRGSRVLLLENLIRRAKEHDAEFTTLSSAVDTWTAKQSDSTSAAKGDA